jgi:hypothetical protein
LIHRAELETQGGYDFTIELIEPFTGAGGADTGWRFRLTKGPITLERFLREWHVKFSTPDGRTLTGSPAATPFTALKAAYKDQRRYVEMNYETLREVHQLLGNPPIPLSVHRKRRITRQQRHQGATAPYTRYYFKNLRQETERDQQKEN